MSASESHLPGGIPGEDLWEQDLDFEFSIDMDVFCDIFLDLCLDLDLTDKDLYEMFPGICGQDYEFCPLWEDEWMIGDSCW